MGMFTQTTCYVVPSPLLPMAYTPLHVGCQSLRRLDESRIGVADSADIKELPLSNCEPFSRHDDPPCCPSLQIVIILTRRQLFRMLKTDMRVPVWQTFGARYAAYAATPFYCIRFLGKMAGNNGP